MNVFSLLCQYKYHLFLKQSVTVFCYNDGLLTDFVQVQTIKNNNIAKLGVSNEQNLKSTKMKYCMNKNMGYKSSDYRK